MSNNLLEEARIFLVQTLQGKHNHFESRHPWRRGWEFAVLHSLRVESYVMKIMAREGSVLSEPEVTLIRLAAILHDTGRLDKKEGHANLGAQIAKNWLQEYPNPALESNEIERVGVLIADHSNKEVHEQDFGKAVLKDADTLDEIGAMSIFMSSSWVDAQSPFFFHDLRQRLIDFEIPFCDQKLAILNTDGAKQILKEKKSFLENFVAQITEELQSDPHTEQILFKLSKSGE